jgi:hypothetical protein
VHGRLLGVPAHLDSEQVVRLTGLATLDRSSVKNFYYPAVWQAMDASDQDFGSNSPVYLEMAGASPSTLVVAVSKNGHMYLLDSKNLGGLIGTAAARWQGGRPSTVVSSAKLYAHELFAIGNLVSEQPCFAGRM